MFLFLSKSILHSKQLLRQPLDDTASARYLRFGLRRGNTMGKARRVVFVFVCRTSCSFTEACEIIASWLS